MTTNLEQDILSRRTFAIISHPDAGKTTITEKLLYFGGAIRDAGTVKGKKSGKFATSDWMEIEKQRGISVTSSVMQFDYDGCRVNILDTPGIQYHIKRDISQLVILAEGIVKDNKKQLNVANQLKKIEILLQQLKLKDEDAKKILDETLGIISGKAEDLLH